MVRTTALTLALLLSTTALAHADPGGGRGGRGGNRWEQNGGGEDRGDRGDRGDQQRPNGWQNRGGPPPQQQQQQQAPPQARQYTPPPQAQINPPPQANGGDPGARMARRGDDQQRPNGWGARNGDGGPRNDQRSGDWAARNPNNGAGGPAPGYAQRNNGGDGPGLRGGDNDRRGGDRNGYANNGRGGERWTERGRDDGRRDDDRRYDDRRQQDRRQDWGANDWNRNGDWNRNNGWNGADRRYADNGGYRGRPGDGHGYRDRDRGRAWYDQRIYRPTYRADYRYRAPAYIYPNGWFVRSWSFGEYLPRGWYGVNYYLDWRAFDLPYPPIGCEWVRVGRDALLVDVWTGEILSIYYDLFW